MTSDMMYHFKPDLPLTENLRRVADDQIGSALDSLSDEGELEPRVHDVRKRKKKLRGLIRLVRPGMGKLYKAENREFRDIGRLFSDLRDAQVLTQTLGGLAETAGDDSLAPLIAWSTERRDAMLHEHDLPGRIEEAASRLEDARKRATAWPVEGTAHEVIAGGLKKTYGRARKCWRKAGHEPDDSELLHEWRKRVKYHWYHCRLLREAWPETMHARIDTLDELSGVLGDDHDLVVLGAALEEVSDDLPKKARKRAEELAAAESGALRERAFGLAAQMLGEKKGQLADRLAGYWISAPTAGDRQAG
ncbi:MAG: CHAD domain-containing protein [Marinovum algicola]